TFSALFAELIAQAFEPTEVTVEEGGVTVAKAFSSLPFDHLLFTGSSTVGRDVMRAAAANLTPVTLELGGKSPAIIGGRANLHEAARRIAFGKGLNAGQTCVAPDYVLVPESRLTAFVRHYEAACAEYYPDYVNNGDYSSIVSPAQRKRLLTALAEAEQGGAKIHRANTLPPNWRRLKKLPLLALTDVPPDSALLQDEIFGPFLPIVPYRQDSEAIAFVDARPNPLALYFFGYDVRSQETFLNALPSGGAVVNNTLLQFTQHQLPIGGRGASGMGNYHGFEGFQTFSHARTVVHSGHFSTLSLIFPPYGRWAHRLLKRWVR
ncbi:MAG: aldehyde dehydrogenase family protein, partial [Natronospirillum sp.]